MSGGLSITIFGLNFTPETTGIAPYTSGMAAGLAARGHNVSVVTARPHYPEWRVWSRGQSWDRQEFRDSVAVRRVTHFVPSKPHGARRALSEVSFGVSSLLRMRRHDDVVLFVSPALLATAMLLARERLRRDCPAVGVVLQDLYSAGVHETGASKMTTRGFEGAESWVARAADGVAVIHDRFRDRVVRDLGAAPERVRTIRNWTHVPSAVAVDRRATRESLGWQDTETVVLHAGAMGNKQDLLNVLEAARLAQLEAAPVRFVLMGDGGERQRLETAAAGLNHVDFLRSVSSEVYGRMLRSADVLLVNERPGLIEMAVPSKLTSYFSAGVPVLAATDPRSATADEVRASRAGAIVPSGDPAALLGAVLALARDPARAAELGAQGPLYCDEVLSQEAAIDRYDAWVHDLHARRLAVIGPRRGSSPLSVEGKR